MTGLREKAGVYMGSADMPQYKFSNGVVHVVLNWMPKFCCGTNYVLSKKLQYRIYSAIRWGFPLPRMTTNK